MAFVSFATSIVLSLLLCTTAYANSNGDASGSYPTPPASAPQHQHHHHHHAPAPTPPVKPPTHAPAPVKPPTHAPAPAPAPVKPPTRKMVAIQGVVYCKSCKYRGVDTLLKATPLSGAVVKLQCNNTKNSLVEQKTTDKNGYFFFMPQKLTTSGAHKCKVFLVSSPSAVCNVPTNLHSGAAGATLGSRSPVDTSPKQKQLPFELFTVGPFAFEAAKNLPCHY